MIKKNIFVVSTPLQLLNAIEACHQLLAPGEPAVLWVLAKHPEHHFTWACVGRLADVPFSEVKLLVLNNVSARSGVWAALQALRANRAHAMRTCAAYPQCDRFFVGNPRTREHLYLASLFPRAQVTSLDDGTGTVSFLERVRARGGRCGGGLVAATGLVARLKEVFFRLFYGAYRQPLVCADFYTAFVPQAEAAGFVARKNSYAWLASRLQGRGVRQGSHLLGAPFVERHELSWDQYRAWLQAAAALLPGPVLYVAHWAESDTQLARIERELGLVCQRFGQPYELEYLIGDAAPACVASWFSSALDVLSMVPGEHAKLLALRVPVEAFRKADIADSALSFYERHGESRSAVQIETLL